ncbi:hypothetical protein BJF93_19355 [Xaviernesmea oryzae]|uniref:Uncharacterized protein n=1 Tax=Xaviernesmea oryzae TaxID=464029 RepID=A0A1Q9B1F8_9HYPH|nr:hypothetical protein [Xaviernesmea oryzae]OLP61845.1 hypothetical protein BJF93_19355 [Xaviernesmea oryzae]SEL75643.1 hypothetical protein SAMN04487976_11270 [Xaviernesmea oryzae]
MDLDRFEPRLYGQWPLPPFYGVNLPDRDDPSSEENNPYSGSLDLKGLVQPEGDDLPLILTALTRELCGQIQVLQGLGRLTAAGGEGPEPERKLVQADAKAQVEAISLIVRTLEKIDSLQRDLALRSAEHGEAEDEADYQALLAAFERRVDARAEELAAAKASRRKAKRAPS